VSGPVPTERVLSSSRPAPAPKERVLSIARAGERG